MATSRFSISSCFSQRGEGDDAPIYVNPAYSICIDDINVPETNERETRKSAHPTKHCTLNKDVGSRKVGEHYILKMEGKEGYSRAHNAEISRLEVAASHTTRIFLGETGAEALFVVDSDGNLLFDNDPDGPYEGNFPTQPMIVSKAVENWQAYGEVKEEVFIKDHPIVSDLMGMFERSFPEFSQKYGISSILHQTADDVEEKDEESHASQPFERANELPLLNFLFVLAVIHYIKEEDPHVGNLGFTDGKVATIDRDRSFWYPLGEKLHGKAGYPSNFTLTQEALDSFPDIPGARYWLFSEGKLFMKAAQSWSPQDQAKIREFCKTPYAVHSKWMAFMSIAIVPLDGFVKICHDIFDNETHRDSVIEHFLNRQQDLRYELLGSADFHNFISAHVTAVEPDQWVSNDLSPNYHERIQLVKRDRQHSGDVDHLIVQLKNLMMADIHQLEQHANSPSGLRISNSLKREFMPRLDQINKLDEVNEKWSNLITLLQEMCCSVDNSHILFDEELQGQIKLLARNASKTKYELENQLCELFREVKTVQATNDQEKSQSEKNVIAEPLFTRMKKIDEMKAQIIADDDRNPYEQKRGVDPSLREEIAGREVVDVLMPDVRGNKSHENIVLTLPVDQEKLIEKSIVFYNLLEGLSHERAKTVGVLRALGKRKEVNQHLAMQVVWHEMAVAFHLVSEENYQHPEVVSFVNNLRDRFYDEFNTKVTDLLNVEEANAVENNEMFDSSKFLMDLVEGDIGRHIKRAKIVFERIADLELDDAFNVALIKAVNNCILHSKSFDSVLLALNYANFLLALRNTDPGRFNRHINYDRVNKLIDLDLNEATMRVTTLQRERSETQDVVEYDDLNDGSSERKSGHDASQPLLSQSRDRNVHDNDEESQLNNFQEEDRDKRLDELHPFRPLKHLYKYKEWDADPVFNRSHWLLEETLVRQRFSEQNPGWDNLFEHIEQLFRERSGKNLKPKMDRMAEMLFGISEQMCKPIEDRSAVIIQANCGVNGDAFLEVYVALKAPGSMNNWYLSFGVAAIILTFLEVGLFRVKGLGALMLFAGFALLVLGRQKSFAAAAMSLLKVLKPEDMQSQYERASVSFTSSYKNVTHMLTEARQTLHYSCCGGEMPETIQEAESRVTREQDASQRYLDQAYPWT